MVGFDDESSFHGGLNFSGVEGPRPPPERYGEMAFVEPICPELRDDDVWNVRAIVGYFAK